MDPTRCALLHGSVTFSEAKFSPANILLQLSYPRKQEAFFEELDGCRSLIQILAAHHLGTRPEHLEVAERRQWLNGSYNVCIPLTLQPPGSRHHARYMFRVPLPFKIGEGHFPGASDEKIRCEAGAYTWIFENCPTVPTPKLVGCGLSSGQQFTTVSCLPRCARWYHEARCFLLWLLRKEKPSTMVPHPRRDPTGGDSRAEPRAHRRSKRLLSYLLLETVDQSLGGVDLLSQSWDEGSKDEKRRGRFFRSLSQVLMKLASIPLPCIGSFALDDSGYIRLTNRPLTQEIIHLENQGVPVGINRTQIFDSTDAYVRTLLDNLHGKRLRHVPNAITDHADGRYQMAMLVLAERLLPQLFRRELCHGPFVLNLTDLHPGNIFVDADWNIVSIIDLEFACSLPIEFQQPPQWLTDFAVDVFDIPRFCLLSGELATTLKRVAAAARAAPRVAGDLKDPIELLVSVMEDGLTSGTFWATHALGTTSGLFFLVHHYVVPLFDVTEEDLKAETVQSILVHMWGRSTSNFLGSRLQAKRDYDDQLEELFKTER